MIKMASFCRYTDDAIYINKQNKCNSQYKEI